MAISYISEAQAERTLERELAGKAFDEVQREAAENWEEHLSRIEVEARNEEEQKTFYSCLYRLFCIRIRLTSWMRMRIQSIIAPAAEPPRREYGIRITASGIPIGRYIPCSL